MLEPMRFHALALVFLCGVLGAGEDVVAKFVADVKKLDIENHADVIKAMRKEFDRRVLTPDAKWLRRVPKKPARGGVARLLNRGVFDKETLVRGGGAYWSFTTESNDYDHAPDITLEQWNFGSGFAGGDYGLVMPLGAKSIDAEALGVPDILKQADPRAFYKAARALRRQQPPPNLPRPAWRPAAQVGLVYAVRSVRWSESDVLAVFEVLDIDIYGVTFAWKILKEFPRPGRRR